MALKKTIELDNGLTIPDAYFSVDTIRGTKSKAEIGLNVHISEEAKGDGKAIVLQQSFSFTPSIEDGSPNIIKQAYLHLKTLPEFEGAVDA